ncbi:MAG: HEAT repeat domain-containing protein [Planctomycetota bacterium]
MKRVVTSALLVVLLAGAALAGGFDDLVSNYERMRSKPYTERSAALGALTQAKTKECAAYLGGLLDGERDPAARKAILGYLGEVGKDPATKILEAALTQSRSPEERQAAFDGLARLRPPPPADVYLRALTDPKNTEDLRKGALQRVRGTGEVKVARALATVLAEPNPPVQLRSGCTAALAGMVGVAEVGRWVISEGLTDAKLAGATLDLLTLAVNAKLEGAEAAVARLLESSDPRARAGAAEATGDLFAGKGTLEGCPKLAALLDDKAPAVQAAAAGAIQRIGAQQEVLQKLLALADAKDPKLRTVCLAALIGNADPAAIQLADKALKDKSISVRAAAVQVLAQSKDKGALELLIEALKKNDKGGRLKLDILTALREITQTDAGGDAKDWAKWWGEQKTGFQFKDKPRVVTGSANPAEPPKEVTSKVREGKVPTYYGSEVLSYRIAFVCDISGSMGKASGSTRNMSKLNVLKKELSGVIRLLPGKTHFNIYSFESDWKAWQKRIVPASGGNKKAALDLVASWQSAGLTCLYDALEAALQDPDVDTIYLLSDGAPSRGKYTNGNEIIREVQRLNATRRTVIHTISLGGMSPLLRELAKQTGGQFLVR